jgi:hypothetical protein
MKQRGIRFLLLALLVFLVNCGRGPTFTETLYYGFEVNGVLTGYLEVKIAPGVFLENPLYFPHVIRALAGAEGKQERSRDFRILDTLKAEIQQVTYTLIGSEKLSLAGNEYNVLVVEKEVQETGVTVEDNRIEGIFEIRHRRCDGQQAPPFPPDFDTDESLRPYLEPEDLVEADDPVLVRKAKELTRGAKDSWDALRRLSRWVGIEIGAGLSDR